ncbi:MAG: hypothetical protein Kow0063_26070 [Anaerolineae bacterium]
MASVFYSQGINSPQYYQYKGDLTVEEVAEFYRFLAPHVTLMIVGTQDGLNRLHEMCPNLACPTLFVPQPVLIKPNSNLDDKLPKDRVRLLFVGRDYIRKGLPEVLAAYREVARHAELHVVTAPDCPLMTETTDLPYVTWYADLSDESLQRLYRRSHILVVPTHADTYNLVMVEAMANGCAVVTSDLSPMDEIAPPGVVGETVPRGDVDALADTLKVLVQDRVRLERYMRAALHRYQTEYAPDRVLPRLANAFEYAVSLAR